MDGIGGLGFIRGPQYINQPMGIGGASTYLPAGFGLTPDVVSLTGMGGMPGNFAALYGIFPETIPYTGPQLMYGLFPPQPGFTPGGGQLMYGIFPNSPPTFQPMFIFDTSFFQPFIPIQQFQPFMPMPQFQLGFNYFPPFQPFPPVYPWSEPYGPVGPIQLKYGMFPDTPTPISPLYGIFPQNNNPLINNKDVLFSAANAIFADIPNNNNNAVVNAAIAPRVRYGIFHAEDRIAVNNTVAHRFDYSPRTAVGSIYY